VKKKTPIRTLEELYCGGINPREATAELSNLMEREASTKGFCLTGKIMAEVMDTMRVPDIDE